MSSKTYTERLGTGYNLSVGRVLLFTVPGGEIYIVRTMDAILPVTWALGLFGFGMEDEGEFVLWGVSQPYVEAGVPYHWEGRQAFAAGQQLWVSVSDPGWNVFVTGYVFTEP